MINPTLSEWLNLIFRWVHVFAGIMWVGTTYYFTWLDARLSEEEKAASAAGEPAQIWMVHSGGFYVVEKRKVPDILSRRAAIVVGVGLLVGGWIVYDLMMISPLGRNEKAFAVIAYILIVGLAYGLTRVLSGRAAYIHMGAMFGTIMAANVWMRILPAQKRMIAAIKEGRQPDQALAAQAKLRSKQNTFMAVPVVFTMISNHFPGVTYGEHYNWAILAGLILLGWIAAKFIRRA